MVKHFIPIESNPDVFDEYSAKLGAVNVPTEYQFNDVLGLDQVRKNPQPFIPWHTLQPTHPHTHLTIQVTQELLGMVPQPAIAVLLLFPITADTERLRQEEQHAIDQAGITPSPSSVYFMKQTIGNACGTIGLLHCLANATDYLQLEPNSFLSQFLTATGGMSPAERGAYLEHPPENAPSIDSIHEVRSG